MLNGYVNLSSFDCNQAHCCRRVTLGAVSVAAKVTFWGKSPSLTPFLGGKEDFFGHDLALILKDFY